MVGFSGDGSWFDLDQWVMGHDGSINPHCVAFIGSNLHSFHKSWLVSLFLFLFCSFFFLKKIFRLINGGDAVVLVGCYFGGYFNRLYGGGFWVVVASYDSQWLLWIFVSVFYVFLMGDMLK